ncbi:MAG: hypothetical protein JWN32_2323 [Solirubrobacterales bacterium]|nr:hypothetical protein [Solirubrobacterales bacterium]
MAVDGFMESEVGVAVAATALVFSPRVRGVVRRGAVYGVAGVLKAGDAVTSAGRGVARGVRGARTDDDAEETAAAYAAAASPAATKPSGGSRRRTPKPTPTPTPPATT